MVGEPARPLGQFGKAQPGFAATLVDNPQTGTVVARRHRVEIIERPVEPIEDRPAELPISRLVIVTVSKQKVPRL